MDDIEYYEQRVAYCRQIGNQFWVGNNLMSLSSAHFSKGNTYKGIEYLKESKAVLLGENDFSGAALACKNLAECYDLRLNDLETATTYMEMAANLAPPNDLMKQMYQNMAKGMREKLNRLKK